MSKTIEIISCHVGKVALKVKGEPVTIEFQQIEGPKGTTLGKALVDHDEAAVLLKVGQPDFWKESVDADAGKDDGKDDPEKTKPRKPADIIAEIEQAADIDAVEKLIEGESRATVLAAAKKRSQELSA